MGDNIVLHLKKKKWILLKDKVNIIVITSGICFDKWTKNPNRSQK